MEVLSEFVDGLKDIEELSHTHLLYIFHKSSGYALHIKPFLDDHEHDIFATRYPCRPNQIGLSTVRLVSRQGNVLIIKGADVLNGTPLLGAKLFVPDFDHHTEDVQVGWYKTRSKK